MATTAMRNAAILEEANMLMLMTLPNSQVTTLEAIKYLWRGRELKKLQRRLAEEEVRETNLPTSTVLLPYYTDE